MNSPRTASIKLNNALGSEGKAALFTALIMGLVAHMPALVADIPNHDGLSSVYFSQNMLTSGRWFLGPACAVSSYYSLHWLIGVLALLYLAIAAVFVVKLLDVKSPLFAGLIAGLMVTFPGLASNFAYLFTMDGYMMGLLFAVLAVYMTAKVKRGFIFGACFLALSMGTYQAYLPVAMLLSLYMVLMIFAEKTKFIDKLKKALNYLYMGVIGVALYYGVLKLLLAITGKELDTYQGMNSAVEKVSLLDSIKAIYKDFASFTVFGKVIFTNAFATVAAAVIAIAFAVALIVRAVQEKWLKSVWFYVIGVVTCVAIPLFTNAILLISKDVTYHMIMRYQWVLFGVLALAFIENSFKSFKPNTHAAIEWCMLVTAAVCILSNVISVNVAYSNLEKKYEKTYAYCLRLADRIEQTEGYYQGIPIYMIGVIGDDNFPETDITADVTDHMIGIGGQWLFYRPENFELFYKHYMGITFNFLTPDEANFYDTKEYVDMPSFPGAGSTKVVDGILYVKTENMH